MAVPPRDDLFWDEFFELALRDSAAALEPEAAEAAEAGGAEGLAAAARQLAAVERRYRALLDHLPVATWIAEADEPLRPRYVCREIEGLLGYPSERWLAEPGFWAERVHPEDRQRVVAGGGPRPGGEAPSRREYRMIAADGREVAVREETRVIELGGDGAGAGTRRLVQGVLVEIPPREGPGEGADHRPAGEEGSGPAEAPAPPYHDGLTRLPDRTLLLEHLELALARAREEDREIALLHVDLDDFRLVNDSLGHEAGDEVLRQVAGRLDDLTLPTTTLGRHGDDEFLILLPDLRRGGAEEVARIVAGQVAAALDDPFTVAGAEFELGASVGLSVFPHDARDADTLLRHADAAMHQAKEAGRGGFAVYAGGTLDALEQLSIPIRLRRALDRGEFVLHYQPIFRLATGEVESVEALIRWRDPERGLVAPLEFIPAAEYTGLIDPIGDWVIGEVCAQARAWRDQGLETRFSFNASLRQFCGPGLAGTLRERLAAHGVEAAALTVEITESTAMREPERVEPVLRELKELGMRIAIDDFGIGYSSLGRLRQMPVSTLKIDRSFMADVPGNPAATNIVAATLELVAALGMEAVAEGVETEEQRRFLADQGCGCAQGFHLAEPMPPEEASALLRGPSASGS